MIARRVRSLTSSGGWFTAAGAIGAAGTGNPSPWLPSTISKDERLPVAVGHSEAAVPDSASSGH